MLQALKSLVALGLLGGLAMFLARLALAPTPVEWARLKHYAWVVFGVTAIAYSSIGVWAFLIISAGFVWRFGRDLQPAVLMGCLLFAVPPYRIRIDAFGSTLFQFGVLSIFTLISAHTLYKVASPRSSRSKVASVPLFAAAVWIVYQVVNVLLATSLTNAIKVAFEVWLSFYLVLYVFVAGLRTDSDIKEFVKVFSVMCMFLAVVGVFESFRHWLLYPTMEQSLGIYSTMGGYLERSSVSMLRAQASAGNPIALSGLLAVGLLFALVASEESNAPVNLKYVGVLTIFMGLIFTFSRGGWVSAFAGMMVYHLAGAGGMSKVFKFMVAFVALIGLAFVVPGGEKVINMLPFVGKTDAGSVDYRAQIVEVSFVVFLEHPWFGSNNFMSEPIMQQLIQGEGIIDIVNTYLGIVLGGGLVGLLIFVSIFMPVVFVLVSQAVRGGDQFVRTALAAMVIVMVLITTVSFVDAIPYLFWVCTGLGIAVAAKRDVVKP